MTVEAPTASPTAAPLTAAALSGAPAAVLPGAPVPAPAVLVTSVAAAPLAVSAPRVGSDGVHPLFLARWSRRSLSTRPIAPEHVRALFEAARWAPSASNAQPWLFVYAEGDDLEPARALLNENNRRWAGRAPLLVFLFSRRQNPSTGQPLRSAAFDTGAAWMSFALQAQSLGLSARAMGGILREETYGALGVPREEFEIGCGIAVGYPESAAQLPDDLAARETPSARLPVERTVFRGRYRPGPAQ